MLRKAGRDSMKGIIMQMEKIVRSEHEKSKMTDKKHPWWVAAAALWAVVLVFVVLFARTQKVPRDALSDGLTVNFSGAIIETQPFRAEMKPARRSPVALKVMFVRSEFDEPVREPVTVELRRQDGTVIEIWQLEPESILTDGRYTEIPMKDSGITAGDPVVLTITSPETKPTRALRINMVDADGSEVTAWYHAEEQQPDLPQVTFGYLVDAGYTLRVTALWAAVGLFVLLCAVVRRRGAAWLQWLMMIVFTACSLPVTLYLVEDLGGHTPLQDLVDPWRALGLNALLYVAVLLLFWGLTGSSAVGCSVGNGLMLLIGVINCYVKEARGTPFQPQDISGATTALGVADHVQLQLYMDVVYAICWICAVVLISVTLDRRIRLKKGGILCRVPMLAAGAALILAGPQLCLKLGGELSLYRPETDYRQNSVIVGFTKNFTLMTVKRPQGYSAKQLQQRVADAIDPSVATPQSAALQKNAALTAERLPNIFVVMDESFTDVSPLVDLEAIGVTEPLLPNLYALAEDPAAHVGKATVPVWGGATCNSEYEALTGFSYRIDSAGGAPYLKYFRRETPTIGRYMTSLGYQTGALHLLWSYNWYRDRAYPNMGFDEITFLEDVQEQSGGDPEMLRNFATDRAGYRMLNETLTEDAPQFRFYITVQNHSTYNGFPETDDVEEVQTAGLSEEDETGVETYLTLLKCSDEQLSEWLGQLSETEEPTVVLFFGDHWCCFDRNIMQRLEEQGAGSLDEEKDPLATIKYYSTPYLLWSNCGYDFSTAPDRLSLNYLSAVLMQQLGLPLTQWQQLELTMMQDYPVYSLMGVLDEEGNIVAEDDPGLQEWVQLISAVHYNALNDRRNLQWDIFN